MNLDSIVYIYIYINGIVYRWFDWRIFLKIYEIIKFIWYVNFYRIYKKKRNFLIDFMECIFFV